MGDDDKTVLVGRFGAPHGVRGEIRIKSFTADPGAIGAYGPLVDETGARHTIVTSLLLRDDLIVARLAGVNDADAARELTGRAVSIARAQLPAPDDDEFYIADLIGMRAVAPDGAALGVVKNVLNFGAGDILEIAPVDAPALLVAFTRRNAPEIRHATREIVVVVDTPPRADADDD